jgi:hypothetical protein
MAWDELVRSVVGYWLGKNLTPNSMAGHGDGQARLLKKSPPHRGESA